MKLPLAKRDLESIYNSGIAYAFVRSPGESWPVEFVSDNIRLLGYVTEDFTSGRIFYADIIHPHDIESLRSALQEYQEHEDKPFFNFEYRIFDSSGNVHWVAERSVINRDPAGKVTHLDGIILDITEKKEAQIAVENANEYLEGIINTVREPLMILDSEVRVISASRSFYQFFKLTPEETEDHYFYELDSGQWNILELKPLIQDVLSNNRGFDDFEVEVDFKNIGRRIMLLNAHRIQSKSRPMHSQNSLRNRRMLLNAQSMRNSSDENPMVLLAIEDITQRKHAEVELRLSEEKYSNLVEKGNDAIIIVQDEVVRFVNSKLSEFSGYSKEELLGGRLQDHLLIDYRRMVSKKYNKALKDRRSIRRSYEIEFLKKDGGSFPAEISFSFIHHEDNPAVMMTIRDITQRKQAENELKASEEKYSTLVEKGSDGIVIVQDEVIKFLNHKLTDLTGCAKGKSVGMSFLNRLPVEYRRVVLKKYQQVLKKESSLPHPYEVELLSGNDSTFPAEISFSFIQHEGRPAVMLTVRDITQRKQAENELKASEKKYSTLVEKGNDGIVVVQDDVLVFANLKFGQITGYTKEESIGEPFGSFIAMEYIHMVTKKIRRSLEKQRNERRKYEAELLSKDERHIPVEINTSIIEHEGRPACMAIIRDITKQKQKEKQLLDLIAVEQVLEDVIKSSPAVVFFWRPENDWPVDFVSENISQFGYEAEEFTSGKLLYGDIIHPSDLDTVREEVSISYKEGKELSHEYRILTKSGEVKWVDERSVIKRDPSGNVQYIQGIIVDITERKNINNFMRIESDLGNFFSPTGDIKDIFNQLLEFTVQVEKIDCGALYLVDELTGELNLVAHKGLSPSFVESTKHYDANSITARLFMAGYPLYKLYHEISALTPRVNLRYEGLEATAIIPVRYQEKFVAVLFLASHTEYDIPANVRNSLETISSQAGAVIGRIKEEVDVHKNQNSLQLLFNSLEDLLFVINSDGCILHTNQFAHTRLGYLPDEIVGKNMLKLYPSNKALEAASVLGDIISGRSSISTVPFESQAGEIIPVETKFTKAEWNGEVALVALSREISSKDA
ncbi:PAS domain S-box protein [Methanolobus sp. ZRKC3]|uniref:PAS domain S-box protein n=1 Tax=Methanolobus sp. ZRKC3 TaxID=3125786 RepID=UPI003249FC9A